MNGTWVMNFIVTCSFLHTRLTKPCELYSSAHVSFESWKLYESYCWCWTPYFRWLEQLVVPLMTLGNQAVVDRSSRHRHRSIWRKCLPSKLSCFTKLFKGSNSSSNNGVGTMSTNLKLHVTWISWDLSPLCSTWWMSPWMRMLGLAQSSPSFHYSWYHVRMQIRPILPRNNFAVLLAFPGIITMSCSRVIILSHRTNSRLHSEPIIFQKGWWKEN